MVYYMKIDIDETTTDDEGNTVSKYSDSDSDGLYDIDNIYILANNTVSYSTSITNEDLEDYEDGDITLSFKAYAIQSDSFSTVFEALMAALGNATASGSTSDTLSVTVATTIATDSTTESTSTTFTATIPTSTTLQSSGTTTTTDEDGNETTSATTITSLTLVVSETTADTVAVVPDGDAGDYTYKISLVDQDGNSVSATSGYMNVSIQIKTGITASNLTVTKLGDSDTTLSTTTSTDGSDYYSYDSTTGVLTIYTQSLGEYEIYWNDTGLGISSVSESDLSFSLSSLGTTTYNHEVGWALDNGVYSVSDSSGYYEYFIDYALTYNTDVSSLRFKGVTYDNSGGTVWVGNPYARTGKSVTSGQTVLLMQDIFELSFGSEASNVDRLYTVKGIKAAYTTNYSKGFYFVSNHGTNATMVGTTSYSVEVELRLYEVADSKITGSYIVLDTLTLTYTYTE